LVEQRDYDLTDETRLAAGQLTTVPPGLAHRFETEAEGAECLEFYYLAPVEGADIRRLDCGGRRQP
jgi:mannose-6-phosphate isomerase-like protein (cupin superfamily)